MSQGGTQSAGKTKRELRRELHKEMLAKLKLLSPGPNDVFVIEVADDFFGDEERIQSAQIFAQDLQRASGRDVFIVKEGFKLTTVPDPRQAQKQQPPPAIATPPKGIFLPKGVKLDG